MDKIINKMTKCSDSEDISELWDLIGKYHSENIESAHNLIVGIPVDDNKVLFYQLISGKGDHFVKYPPEEPKRVKNAIISSIAILDVKNDENGGEPTIQTGGVGQESVEIKLESQWCRRISFCVIIIGKYFEDIAKNSIYNRESLNDICLSI